jgi:hypothetical protein
MTGPRAETRRDASGRLADVRMKGRIKQQPFHQSGAVLRRFSYGQAMASDGVCLNTIVLRSLATLCQ